MLYITHPLHWFARSDPSLSAQGRTIPLLATRYRWVREGLAWLGHVGSRQGGVGWARGELWGRGRGALVFSSDTATAGIWPEWVVHAEVERDGAMGARHFIFSRPGCQHPWRIAHPPPPPFPVCPFLQATRGRWLRVPTALCF
eukprot:scaffold22852_cov88-Isochrysis_galbana.AAC.3